MDEPKIDATRKSLNVAIPEGHLALDSSVLIEMLNASELGSMVNNAIVAGTIVPHTSFVNIAEAGYILCRRIGHEIVKRSMESLLSSGYLSVEEDKSIHSIASELKCERAISLPDCYTFAVAEVTSSKPIFVSRERELIKEIDRKPFKVEPLFLT